MRSLIIIPARAGSKRLPGKNTRMLGGKPLVAHTIEFALQIRGNNDVICVSSNDDDVIEIARKFNLDVPFKRPEELASDQASSHDVVMHALNYYESQNLFFDAILLLQPTSPFRVQSDFEGLMREFTDDCDMAVSVKSVKETPYINLFEQNKEGYLEKSKKGDFASAQQCPAVYAYNGSMYLIRTSSIKKSYLHDLRRIKKLVMPEERSVDIDTRLDWAIAEYILSA